MSFPQTLCFFVSSSICVSRLRSASNRDVMSYIWTYENRTGEREKKPYLPFRLLHRRERHSLHRCRVECQRASFMGQSHISCVRTWNDWCSWGNSSQMLQEANRSWMKTLLAFPLLHASPMHSWTEKCFFERFGIELVLWKILRY